MPGDAGAAGKRPRRPDWYKALGKYEQPDLRKAVWQLCNTFIPYLALWALMLYLVMNRYPYWMVVAPGVLAAGLMMRIFIFFHDCCHGSFFASPRANRILGYITGTMVLTPFDKWRASHLFHHSAFANLDRRGTGDALLMTVEEYRNAPPLTRAAYWLYRQPLFLFTVAPAFMFAVIFRFPKRGAKRSEHLSVALLNAFIVLVLLLSHLTIGIRTILLVQLPILLIVWNTGVWFFYIQHQFHGVYWAREKEWDFIRASLEGASYYRLPAVLQWFSGNIGLHHLHHLRPRIPNYHLQRCYDETPAVQGVTPVTLRSSLRSLGLNVYDEQRRELVSFRSLRE